MGIWTPGPGATDGNDVFTGDDTAETADGGQGQDNLSGGGGDDVLDGGNDSDNLFGDGGNDILNGGAGDDFLIGGAGADTIHGGAGRDYIVLDRSGQMGDETFDTRLWAGDSGQTLTDDTSIRSIEYGTIYAGSGGNDTVILDFTQIAGYAYNSPGTLSFSVYDPALGALPGWYLYGVEHLQVIGSAGGDLLYGGVGNDRLEGGAGVDYLDGAAGDDMILGGAGDDYLTAGGGVDVIDGGDGRDYVVLDRTFEAASEVYDTGAWRSDVGQSFLDGSIVRSVEYGTIYAGFGNNDVVRLDFSDLSGFAYNAAGSFNFSVFDPQLGALPGWYLYGVEDLWIAGSAGSDYFYGGGGNDVIDGGGGGDTLSGGEGDDSVSGGGGNDYLIAGPGIDVLDGGGGHDYVQIDRSDRTDSEVYDLGAWRTAAGQTLGDGTSVSLVEHGTVTAGSGAGDVARLDFSGVAGYAFNTADSFAFSIDDPQAGVIVGWFLNGFETLEIMGSAGDDILYGGLGADAFEGAGGNDWLSGGGGRDTASYAGAGSGVTVRLWAGTAVGGAGNDTLASIENVSGSAYADSLIGSDGIANSLSGEAGNDYLNGLSGNDTLEGGSGNDTLDGGAGIDTASYWGAGAGVVLRLWNGAATGGAGSDTLANIENAIGTAFVDSLIGSNGVDNRLEGREGNDYLNGLTGDDHLLGGAGNDLLEGGLGADTLDGGDGIDVAYYLNSTAAVTVRLWNQTTAGAAGNDVFISIENITGSNYSDALIGAEDVGNVLSGEAGNDFINGLGGDDTLIGGTGNDTLWGGTGNDALDGGAGLDTFLFDTALGLTNVDRIIGYSVADDTIRLENSVFTGLPAGALSASAFAIGASATTAAHRIVYNTTTGELFFDADGSGAGAAILFATLNTGLGLTAADFLVV